MRNTSGTHLSVLCFNIESEFVLIYNLPYITQLRCVQKILSAPVRKVNSNEFKRLY